MTTKFLLNIYMLAIYNHKLNFCWRLLRTLTAACHGGGRHCSSISIGVRSRRRRGRAMRVGAERRPDAAPPRLPPAVACCRSARSLAMLDPLTPRLLSLNSGGGTTAPPARSRSSSPRPQ
jgi:hypothetical protein